MEGFTKWHDLSIIRLLYNTKDIDQAQLTLENLEWVDFKLYNEVAMLNEIPLQFVDIYGEG